MKTALIISFMFLSNIYNIELAITPSEQATGLMYRQQWTESFQGMLFINTYPRKVSFWMKNTYLDMDIYYLDKDFNIVEIHTPQPLDETGIPSKSNNIQYILELNPALKSQVTQNWELFKTKLKQELEKNYSKIQRIRAY